MKGWLIPVTFTFILWGIQGFVAKLTTQYISPMSALLFNIVGSLMVGVVVLYLLGFSPEIQPKGVALAVFMGTLGILGALGYLFALRHGSPDDLAELGAYCEAAGETLTDVLAEMDVPPDLTSLKQAKN